MMNIDNIENSLANILDKNDIKLDKDSKEKYSQDWSSVIPDDPLAITFPKSTSQVKEIVKFCNINNISFIPSGGRTGLSGGATAIKNELIISFEKMDKITNFDESSRIVTCQPGLITKKLQDFADQNNLFYPIEFSSTGSSQIGGNIATNAGGIRVIKYGLTGKYVKGIKMISGNGDFFNFDSGLIKNATGPDLKNLLIGSEGIFGLTTSCSMQLIEKQKETKVAMIGLNDINKLDFIRMILCKNNDIEAIEFFTDAALSKVIESFNFDNLLGKKYNFYLIVEYSETRTEKTFESLIKDSYIDDVIISQNLKQKNEIWKSRLLISESIVNHNPYKYDIAVPISKFNCLVKKIESYSKDIANIEPILFGHIGDGNLHANFIGTSNQFSDKTVNALDSLILNIIIDLKGTISAEHGIGVLKKSIFSKVASKNKIDILKSVKSSYDHKNLLNPGKLIF